MFRQSRYKVTSRFGIYPFLLMGATGLAAFNTLTAPPRECGARTLRHSGYYIVRTDDDYFLLDAGKPCPDYLPAHAHADLFAYELWCDSQAILVDSGVYTYEPGEWRSFFRSTRAHNTAEVEQQDQSEMWSSFRVARRATPHDIRWEVREQGVFFQGTHDGYRRLRARVMHRRTIFISNSRLWTIVDEFSGTGTASAATYLHLHPAVSIASEGGAQRLTRGYISMWLAAIGNGAQEVIRGATTPRLQGWYSERFGQLQANPVMTLTSSKCPLPFFLAYVLAADGPPSVDVVSAEPVALRVNGLTLDIDRLQLRPR